MISISYHSLTSAIVQIELNTTISEEMTDFVQRLTFLDVFCNIEFEHLSTEDCVDLSFCEKGFRL